MNVGAGVALVLQRYGWLRPSEDARVYTSKNCRNSLPTSAGCSQGE